MGVVVSTWQVTKLKKKASIHAVIMETILFTLVFHKCSSFSG